MIIHSTAIIIADLKSRYKQAIKEDDDQRFFMRVADYGRYLFDEEITRRILVKFKDDSRSEIQSYKQAFTEYLKKWKEYAADLLHCAQKAGFIDDYSDPFKTSITAIEHMLEGKKSFLSDNAGSYWLQYCILMKRFHDEGKDGLVIPKHFDRHNNFYNLQLYYNHATSEWDIYLQRREIQPWWAYNQVERLAMVAFNMDRDRRILKGYSEGDAYHEYDFKNIFRGSKANLGSKSKFMKWIDVLHDYIISRLEDNEQKGIPATKKSVRFENNALYITFADNTQKTIDFEVLSRKTDILTLFKVLYKHWQKHKESDILNTSELKIRLELEGIDKSRLEGQGFISTTVKNLRTKILAKDLADIVSIIFSKTGNGYYLRISNI